MRVVICGGGVVGASIACFLSRRGVGATVVERTALACAASGKSGGFLAFDWCDGTPLQNLARRSFRLHAQLAEEIDADWGFRRLVTYGGLASAGGLPGRSRRSHQPDWLSENVVLDRTLGTTEATAQVLPEKFAAALVRAAEANGATLRIGNVTGIDEKERKVTGVIVDGEVVPADAIVIAMGPWSVLAAEWLPLPAIYGLKGHSIIFETGDALPPEALFLEYEDVDGNVLSPEIFPRPDRTAWCCAISSDSPLPLDPATVWPDPGAMERLEKVFRGLSPALADAKVIARQACFRPVTRDGLPLIGTVPGLAGAYVATGHSVWGILNAPATGEAMAELIVDGASRSVDLKPFNPGRMRPLDPRDVRVSA
jgi:glycine/D-amino acid oxidase-like deaminating enzyme